MFVLNWAMGQISWFIKGAVSEDLLTYIAVQFGVVVSGYFAKSTVENREKIKVPNEPIIRDDEDNR